MSVRHEVVTLSQLLRRNENSNSRRAAGRAPSLPLQGSAGHRTAGRQSTSVPLTERPATSRYQPLTFTERVRDASRLSTSQPEGGASSQTSGGFPLSHEVYAPESEQLSAITSMSQSSFSQTQSQNLLGSSQDDQLHRLQHWQTQQIQLPPPPLPPRCSNNEKFQELEQNLTKAIAEHTHEQEQQHKDMLARLASPIKKSVDEIQASLTTRAEEQEEQRARIKELADSVKGVVASVADLHQQRLETKVAFKESRKTVADEAEAVKAALSALQARVGTVEGSVKSCSDLVIRVLNGERMKHQALLSAVEASSCHCPQDAAPAEVTSEGGRATRKRRRIPRRRNSAERNPACYTSPPSADGSPLRTRSRSLFRYEDGTRSGREMDQIEADSGGLYHALQRIEALRAKRCNYLHDL
ncbi:hypothetical protein PRIC1_012200 [Phytophthora ramorum]